ncbi:MAG: hypothetical protein QOH81_1059 [Sphingomonadales bacterium]|jgi:hypothetical protein|nr:hypothetical protein [Sphingomonadales bacterium]
MADPEPVVMLWVGEKLGRVERACIRSILRFGHPVILYCYDDVAGVPDGVRVEDARMILTESAIVRHQSGSLALFADRFRFELLRLGRGIWVDCDAYLLAPLPASPYVMGFESPTTINVGILRVPADSPILPPLLALFENRTIPPWISAKAKLAAAIRRMLTGTPNLSKMPWGTAGPTGFTHLARKFGLEGQALAPEVLYPVHWSDAGWILDPARSLEEVTTPRTVSLHLWNAVIAGVKDKPARRGSFLARLQDEGS